MNANLFAGILLMPTPSFTEMFNKFKNEQNEEDSDITVFCKLMSYFEVPYMATLIRTYELGLLSDGEILKSLLEVDIVEIEKEFFRLWLDKTILYSTGRDDYERLQELIRNIGKKYTEEDILSEDILDKIALNISKIYNEIRG